MNNIMKKSEYFYMRLSSVQKEVLKSLSNNKNMSVTQYIWYLVTKDQESKNVWYLVTKDQESKNDKEKQGE